MCVCVRERERERENRTLSEPLAEQPSVARVIELLLGPFCNPDRWLGEHSIAFQHTIKYGDYIYVFFCIFLRLSEHSQSCQGNSEGLLISFSFVCFSSIACFEPISS